VSSYDFSVSLGLMPLGMAVAGPIAVAVGLHATLVALGALGMLAALSWLAVPDVRRVRRAGAVRPEPAPVAPPVVTPGVSVVAAPAVEGPRFERSARVEDC
jgi:hypothetical protein